MTTSRRPISPTALLRRGRTGAGTRTSTWTLVTVPPSSPAPYAARWMLGGRLLRHTMLSGGTDVATRHPTPVGGGHRAAAVAVVPVGELDEHVSRALDAATALAETVIAIHVCDPHYSEREYQAFQDAWDATGPNVALVLATAAPQCIGDEIAGYIRRRCAGRRVHVVIAGRRQAPSPLGATPPPVVQLERALRSDLNVNIHCLTGTRGV